LARGAHEGFALAVFIRPRRFANEHQLCINVAHAENNGSARTDEVRALDAAHDASA
jgi:hypothetical protein